MFSRKPAARAPHEPAPDRAAADSGPAPPGESIGRRAFLRTNLPPASAVGVLMGLVAAQEGSGGAVAVVVAVAGCAVVLGLLLLKKALYGP